ncbi:hypothetical protein [Quadrisphaera setariae]|uniref:Core-binding (CB) domain-containing protein n=1 Tax=Quadrisphaera setariae TaxID=2593304 RepID=A0A5C8ZFQ6_9ACTN|nr:hypothetical protein [Quadrisphaera setariae]TXR56667.1 hypothetical protein FMM08_07850 [Quadrisphaera setariae]
MTQDDDATRATSSAQVGPPAAPAAAATDAPTARPTALSRLVEDYLATLGSTSPSTQRQRTWALRELLAWVEPSGASSPTTALAPQPVRAWLDTAATADPPASLPGLRARAGAVRALTQHAETTGAVPVGTAAALAGVLRMPAPPLAPGPDPDPVRRLLIKAHPDARPLAVHPAVWTRFCAHVHLLALTGEREDVMATLRLADVTTSAAPSSTPADTTDSTTDSRGTSHSRSANTSQDGGDLTGVRKDGFLADAHTSPHPPHIDPVSGSHIDGDAVTPPLFTENSHDGSRPDSREGLPPEGEESDAALAPAAVDAGAGWERPEGWAGTAVATHVRIETGLAPRAWKLPEPARTALSGWLADRTVLASLLRGSDPGALWLRVRPSTDLRTGALRPAGLPLSDRGLRLAFTTTLAVLALEDRDLEDLSTAAVRAYARGRGPV